MKELSERELLLRSAKSCYSLNEVPAVHPRYGAIYQDLYRTNAKSRSSFGLRLIVSLILFLLYMALEQGYVTGTPITTDQIIEQIELPFYVTQDLDYL